MDPILDLAPGAEENALAVELVARIRESVRDPAAARDFASLRASVLVVAEDLGESFTLRFDHGRLTVHDGSVGVPSVTFCGDAETLRRLSQVPLGDRLRLPKLGPFSTEGRATWALLGNLIAADFKVYGLAAHPRTVLHLVRLLSRKHSGDAAPSGTPSVTLPDAGATKQAL